MINETDLKTAFYKARLIVQEMTGLVNLKLRNVPMTPEEQKQQVEQLKNGVLTTALAKTQNCADKLRTLLDHAFYWATRSHNDHIQGKLSEASLKLSELLEIMSDPEIQALVGPENELPDFMKNLQDSSET